MTETVLIKIGGRRIWISEIIQSQADMATNIKENIRSFMALALLMAISSLLFKVLLRISYTNKYRTKTPHIAVRRFVYDVVV